MNTITKLGLGALIGGIIIFVWGMVSWCVLPFHAKSMNQFKDEAAVQQTVVMNTPQAGNYMFPYPGGHETASPEARKELMKKSHEQMAKGPFAVLVVSPQGLGSMKLLMIRGLIIQVAIAFLITLLLLWANIQSYLGRLAFVFGIALLASVEAFVQNWNWIGFSLPFTFVGAADIFIGYLTAGLVIAKITSPEVSGRKR